MPVEKSKSMLELEIDLGIVKSATLDKDKFSSRERVVLLFIKKELKNK